MSVIIMGRNTMDIPIIQGGMGVGISLSNLAGSVAKHGGMGVISGVNPGYKDKKFMKDPLNSNKKALRKEIAKAKEISQGKGIIGVNVMYAVENYNELVKACVEAGADAIISGAGMPLNLPDLVKEDTLIAPIVSSVRALKIIMKTWMKRYNRLCDFIIVEGPLAGGHLGFKEKDLGRSSLDEILGEVVKYLDVWEKEYKKKIYIFAAGGIRDSNRRMELMDIGADGIQVATPFIPTIECDADQGFKEEIINASNIDLEIIQSPVGMPARAIRNTFLKDKKKEEFQVKKCLNCLKTCDPQTSPYCIAKALGQSAKGRGGLVFSGYNIEKINEITSVVKVIDKLMGEV